jgi:hypothetical protein
MMLQHNNPLATSKASSPSSANTPFLRLPLLLPLMAEDGSAGVVANAIVVAAHAVAASLPPVVGLGHNAV